jgi:hypothetical protein
VGLMGTGSSRDSEVRGALTGGNSVALTDGVVGAESGGNVYVGDLGVGGVSLSVVGSFISTGGTIIGGAVIERSGAVRPGMTGETLSPAAWTGESGTPVDAGLGRAKP